MIVEFGQLAAAFAALVIAIVALFLARRTHSVTATAGISDWFRRVIFTWGAAYNMRRYRDVKANSQEINKVKVEIWALIEEGRLFFPNWNFDKSRNAKGYRGALLTFVATEFYDRVADKEMDYERFNDSLRKFIEIANESLPTEYRHTMNNYDNRHKKLIKKL